MGDELRWILKEMDLSGISRNKCSATIWKIETDHGFCGFGDDRSSMTHHQNRRQSRENSLAK